MQDQLLGVVGDGTAHLEPAMHGQLHEGVASCMRRDVTGAHRAPLKFSTMSGGSGGADGVVAIKHP